MLVASDSVTTRSGDDPEAFWRRPAAEPDAGPEPDAGAGPEPGAGAEPRQPAGAEGSQGHWEDSFYRRPVSGGRPDHRPDPAGPYRFGAAPVQPGGPGQAPGGYAGPPPNTPPPPGWRPPVYLEPSPPRQLPEQDADALDREERGARSRTVGLALVAGAVLVVIVCLLCSRLLF